MNLTTRQKRIGFAVVLTGAAIGYWYHVKKRNDAEAAALIQVIDGTLTQNDFSKMSNEIVSRIETMPLTKGSLQIDNIKDSNKANFKNAMVDTVMNLAKSMKGAGTDVRLFSKNFSRIKNKATMKFANELYKAINGESLFDAIQGESALYTGSFSKGISDPFNMLNLPNYHPSIVKYLASLK